MIKWQRCSDPTPTLIRGVLYSSMNEASRALGVDRATIYKAREAGTLETCGLRKTKALACDIDGVTYPSIQKAARATGIPYSTLQKRLKKERAAEPK